MRISARTDATLRQMKDSMSQVESENEKLRRELVQAEQRVSYLSRDLDQAIQSNSNSEERLTNLSRQLDSKTKEIGKLQQKLVEMENSRVNQQEIERLKQRLQNRESACERAIEQAATLRARMAELTARITPVRTQLLLAAARANAIVASVTKSSTSSMAKNFVMDSNENRLQNGGSVPVAVAGQLEAGLRMAANELDQLISPVLQTSNGAPAFDPDDALSPPPMYQNSENDDDDLDVPSTGHLPNMPSLLQQNKELGDTIYKLSLELRQNSRNAVDEQVSKDQSEHSEKQVTLAKQQIRDLTAKYVRAEGHRKALVYQKRYLMLVIGDFRDTERQILVKLKAIDSTASESSSNYGVKSNNKLFSKNWHSRANACIGSSLRRNSQDAHVQLRPLSRFKAAASSVIFLHR